MISSQFNTSITIFHDNRVEAFLQACNHFERSVHIWRVTNSYRFGSWMGDWGRSIKTIVRNFSRNSKVGFSKNRLLVDFWANFNFWQKIEPRPFLASSTVVSLSLKPFSQRESHGLSSGRRWFGIGQLFRIYNSRRLFYKGQKWWLMVVPKNQPPCH